MTKIRAPQNGKHTQAIDLAIRFALAITFAVAAGVYLNGALAIVHKINPDHINAYQIGQLLSVLAICLYTLMISILYILRLRARNILSGIAPSAAAILGGFLMSALLFFSPRDDLPLWALITASALVVIGNIFTVLVLLSLGRSFSILPEGRRLVTHGPYAVVRHPLYLAEAVAAVGALINFLSPWTFLLVGLQLVLQMVRIHYEEKVLHETFPEYADYAQKTWRLIPGIY